MRANGMVRAISQLGVFLALAMICLTAAAQNGSYKVGVVNRVQVFEEYEKQKDEMSTIREEVNSRQAEIDQELQRLESEQGNLQSRLEGMTEDERRDAEEDFIQRIERLQRQRNEAEGEINRKASRVIQDIKQEIDDAVEVIGARDDYHLIFDADDNPRANSPVIYFNATLDITGEVVDYLNTQYESSKKK